MISENTEQVETQISHKMDATIENLKREIGGIHAGRVSPVMVDSIKVDYYGNLTPISQMANISTPEPMMLSIMIVSPGLISPLALWIAMRPETPEPVGLRSTSPSAKTQTFLL